MGGGPRVSGGSSRVAGIAKCPIFGRPRAPLPPEIATHVAFSLTETATNHSPSAAGERLLSGKQASVGREGQLLFGARACGARRRVRRAEFRSDGARASWNDGGEMVAPPVEDADGHRAATHFRASGAVVGEARHGEAGRVAAERFGDLRSPILAVQEINPAPNGGGFSSRTCRGRGASPGRPGCRG